MISEELVRDVKNYLDITWNDDSGDKKISGIIERGQAYLNRIGGQEYDYEQESEHRQLLFDYCRYVRAHALEDFGKNFQAELLALSISAEVKAYEAKHTADL